MVVNLTHLSSLFIPNFNNIQDVFLSSLNLNFIELLYSYNMPSKVIKHIDKLGTFGERNLVRLYASSHMLLKSYNKSQNILESYGYIDIERRSAFLNLID